MGIILNLLITSALPTADFIQTEARIAKIDSYLERNYSVADQGLHPDDLFWQLKKYSHQKDTIDYWKTPDEFYRDGGGDCEDYAMTLISESNAWNRASVLVGKHRVRDEYHAVAVIDGFVYDNMRKRPIPESEYNALDLVYRANFRKSGNTIDYSIDISRDFMEGIR